MILDQVQDEIENNLDRVLMTRGERCRSVGDLTGKTSEFRQAKSHETQVFSSEFMRRFLMHTLPSGFVRIRYYGFLANRHRNERIEKCRDLLGVTLVPASTIQESQTPAENSDPAPSPKTCPACGRQSLVIIDVVSPTRPLSLRRPYFLTDRTVNSICFDTS